MNTGPDQPMYKFQREVELTAGEDAWINEVKKE